MRRLLPIMMLGLLGCRQTPGVPDSSLPNVETFPRSLDADERRHVRSALAAAKSADTQAAGVAGRQKLPTPVVDPSILAPRGLSERAPDRYLVTFFTTRGGFRVIATRDAAPHAADRFYHLVRIGYFTNTPIYRVIEGKLVQFGLHGDSRVNRIWQRMPIPDDERKLRNRVGTLSFASSGPGTRTTQVVINLTDEPSFDRAGIAPFAQVVEGLAVVSSFFSGYGDAAPIGAGPRQSSIFQYGNEHVMREFPELDYVLSAWVESLETGSLRDG